MTLAEYVETHIMVKSTKETTKTTLKWVHIAIINAKRTLLGRYDKIRGKYLQLYLDEFCYKLAEDILEISALIDYYWH